jgi:hypothetical protein
MVGALRAQGIGCGEPAVEMPKIRFARERGHLMDDRIWPGVLDSSQGRAGVEAIEVFSPAVWWNQSN